MREILFRGKRLDNGEWAEGDYLSPVLDGVPWIWTMEENEQVKVDPSTVGQYTGLTANGKKIFEGDIVQIEDYTHGCALNYKQPTSKWVVHWREDIARFCIDYMPLLSFDFTESEIVGNKWDNPELLEDEG